MTVNRTTNRRRQRGTYRDYFKSLWRLRQVCFICAIASIIDVMLWSSRNNSSRSLVQPYVNSFTAQNFHYHTRMSPRRQLLNLRKQELLNMYTIKADAQRRLYDPRRQRTIMSTTFAAASSSASSAAEIDLLQNETSRYHDNKNSVNTTTPTNDSREHVSLMTPKVIQSEKIWESYTDIINDIIHREFQYRNRGAVQPDELLKVEAYLLRNHAIVQNTPIDVLAESKDAIRDRLNVQKRLFLHISNFTKPMYELYCRCLVYVNDHSARQQVRSPALPTWYKILECGLCPRENAIATCLYVMSLQKRQLSLTVNAEEQKEDVRDDILFKNACVEVATFHDLLYNSNEKTALVRIKGYISDHNVQAAEEVLTTLQIKTQETNSQNFEDSMSYKRLRTYQPIFQYYCDTGNLMDAFRIYREMQFTSGVYLIAETYALLISTAARHGWFRKNDERSIQIKALHSRAMKQLKFRYSYGPDLLDELCTDMSRDVLELDESCAAMIIDGFSVGFGYSTITLPTQGWLSDISQWFQRFLVSPANFQKEDTNNARRIFLERVSIDNATAMCPSSGAKLRLLTLSKHQIRNVHDSLLQMAEFEQEKFGEKGKRDSNKRNKGNWTNDVPNNFTPGKLTKKELNQDARNTSYAVKELSLFSDWLRYRAGDPFTAIIDGPNVAYYGHGDVRWSQVEQVLNKLEGMGENPLVIMPQKYISPKFYIASLGRMQELSPSDLSFINKLIAAKKMYVVPSNCLDDYYWMLSSVAEQKAGSNYKQEHVSTDDPTGRFPGLRPLLVTNDQMRDHRLALLEPRLFRRWTSSHIVKYHIEPLETGMNDEDRVSLIPADFFSREIQCNRASRLADSTAWHIPIAEWPEPDRLCISVIR